MNIQAESPPGGILQDGFWQTPVPPVGQPHADASMAIALYDMLSGLAHGSQCSELAYNFMARATGDVVAGGMLAAAAFLQEFVEDGVEWAHLDIAGPSYNAEAPHGYTVKGGTGVPVRTLVELADLLAGA